MRRRDSTNPAASTTLGRPDRGGMCTAAAPSTADPRDGPAIVVSLIEHSRLSWYYAVPGRRVVRYRLVPDLRKVRRTDVELSSGPPAADADTTEAAGATAFRRRLLDGLAGSIAERGYRATTVADVVRSAKTSKRTFYDEFASKEECFIELLSANNDDMIARITTAVDAEAAPDDQVRAAVEAYVEHIESRPAMTLSWIREAPALGDLARPLNRLAMQHLTDMLVDISTSPGFVDAGLQPISRQLALILLGGLRELTALLVEDDRDVRGVVEPAVTAARALLGLPSAG
ncbi:hypothetical protein TUM20985_02290 [Mycobacterium antarcticum]|nr:hypothetical protein TUM20985_02290 [Mycolicibacterium sp. TUM20985]GLP78822.1 hypothetical protein TUM20984_02420 [Mycolicibacterium sp. TUM20984]